MAYSHDAQRYEAIEAEAAHLRRLIGAAERLEVRALTAEVLYHGARSLFAPPVHRPRRDARHPSRQPGDRRVRAWSAR